MKKTIHHYIFGEELEGKARNGNVANPATGEITKSVSYADQREIDIAVEVAKKAFETWSLTTPIYRARCMFKFKELLEKNINNLAELISEEHGKTLEDSKGDIQRGIEVVEFACGIPHLLKGEFTEQVGTGIDSYSLRQPLGVCAGITPFNFPAMIPLWMFPLSIACGNTFVLKPSEKDPSCPMALVKLLEEAGVPKGVLNVVHGDKEAVEIILDHSDIAAVSFVGSTPVASYVYKRAAASGKRVQALGGAKNHMVVMPDADLDQAADALMGAAYGSAGERCMAVSVAISVGDVGDELINKLTTKVNSLRVGPYTSSNTDMGPLISKQSLERVTDLIDSGVTEGADLVVDGRNLKLQGYENGFFIGGSLFDKVTTDMRIYNEEIFGPVLCNLRVNNYAEALDIVKSNKYGNGCAIFTRDGDTARDFSSSANIGMVGVNVPIPVPVAYHSFGGWKASIFGASNTHGMEGVRFYTHVKTVSSRWPRGMREDIKFSMPTLS